LRIRHGTTQNLCSSARLRRAMHQVAQPLVDTYATVSAMSALSNRKELSMKLFRDFATALAVALCVVGPVLAQDRGTKDEAKAMVDAALDHIKKVGTDRAYKDFTIDKATWTKKDLYVTVIDVNAVVLATGGNEKLIGKNLSGLKDPSGRPLVAGVLETARNGGGWYDYDWADPITKKIAPKSSYARLLPSGDGYVNVGIYR